jgi:tetratricopeptide (TPR) repeat protein
MGLTVGQQQRVNKTREIWMIAKLDEAKFFLEANEYGKALDLFMQAHEESPQDIDVILSLATCLFRLRRYEESISFSLKVLTIDQNLPQAHIKLADAYDAINDVVKSRHEANIAFSLDPNSAEVLGCYGTYLLKDKKIDEGILALEKAEEKDNTLLFVHRNLATAYFHKNDRKRMMAELRKMYKLQPSSKLILEIILVYLDTIKFTKIVASVFLLSLLGAVLFKMWNLLWIDFFCVVLLISLGLTARKFLLGK